jgi:hypothetical protein
MSSPSFLEEPLLGTIDRQVPRAVATLDGVSHEDLDSITRQKLILDAVRAFDLEENVTTQWYLHGDVAVKGKASNRTGSAVLEVPDATGSDIPSSEDVYHYFTEQRDEYVREALRTETFDWLETYYTETERLPFATVYRSGLQIYATLHRLRRAVIEQNPALIPEDIERTVAEGCEELKRSLVGYYIFRDVPPYVATFQTATEPLLRWVDSVTWSDADEELSSHYDITNYLYELFYDGVWKACGQQMSYNTVTGPSADDTRARREREAREQKNRFRVRIDQLDLASDGIDVTVSANVDQLPDLEALDGDTEPTVPREELNPIPDDDPVYDLFDDE